MNQQITMSFPADTAYIGAIRLAMSGIAEKMDFRLDAIEDVKTCVAEACLLLLCGQDCGAIEVGVAVGGEMRVRVSCAQVAASGNGDCSDFSAEISRVMIEALADEAVFSEENGLVSCVEFTKKGEA